MNTDTQKRTILCVDDEQDILDSLYDTFMDDYHVLATTHVNEAIQLFDTKDIALVISDQRMPEMVGSKFLAIINEKKPICKKILLTGYSDLDAAIEAINRGNIDKYFSKPWDSEELKDTVAQLLSTYSVDQLFSRMMKDGKGLKSCLDDEKSKKQLYINAMNALQWPICIVNSGLLIEFVNHAALLKLKYETPEGLLQTHLVDTLLTDISKTDFNARFVHHQKIESTTQWRFKTGDAAVIKSNVQLLFVDDNNGSQLCGFVMID
ncbi:MAG: response regulator receiver protein [Candidatus Magnetoglobus multicellularis str. Araruama]|uniref:Response regulator receiver protein n=1 Tax=Candidatus Magnetoglobus multicellularis str. Araruama TaxID=890399 RepID=A0A1V1P1U2_9BACT|nr:MAG: response regulator receiver protein [Candidatus Magnetoglobus multicellularis str. Araruama]